MIPHTEHYFLHFIEFELKIFLNTFFLFGLYKKRDKIFFDV